MYNNESHIFTEEDHKAWEVLYHEYEEAARTADLTFSKTDPTRRKQKVLCCLAVNL